VDIATLGIEVKSDRVVQGTKALDGLAGAAKRAESATDQVTRSSQEATAAIARQNAVTAATGRVMGGATTNVGNLAAQFQDIGVSAAMSMNPLQIALQQGTQISAVLGPMGAAGAMQSLGAAFMSIISPLSLAVIGFVGLAAAILQWVNWAKVGEVVLLGLADVLVTIAPYAVAAAAAIALLYAPAILGGIAALTWGMARLAIATLGAAAAFALANPAVVFVLGMAAGLAAVLIFRDELKRILGKDIVDDIRGAVNFIIGGFVGAFNSIKTVWSLLPAAMGDIVISTANAVVKGIQFMINEAIGLLNGLIDRANSILPKSKALGTIGKVDFGGIDNPFAGEVANVGAKIKQEMAAAQGPDYVGKIATSVGAAASDAAKKLRELAAGLGGVDKEGAKMAKRYAEITGNARQFIASQEAMRAGIGLTEQAAAALRYEQDLLNQAQDKGLKLTAGQRSELAMLAGQMAASEAATSRLKDALDFTKSTFRGFVSDFKNGLESGKGIWGSFADAALNALNKISDKLLDMAADQLINSLFRSLGGSLGGLFGGGVGAPMNLLPSALGNAFSGGNVMAFAGGGVVSRPTMFPMARGAGLMGEAGPEAIMPLQRGRGGRLGVAAADGGGEQRVVLEVRSVVDRSGNIVPLVREISTSQAVKVVQANNTSQARQQELEI